MNTEKSTFTTRHWPALLVAALTFAGGYWAFAATTVKDSSATDRAPVEVKVDRTPIAADAENVFSFSPIVKKVTPSVVKVVTREEARTVPARGDMMIPGDPNNPLWRFFGPMMPDPRQMPQQQPERRGLGSGVVVSPDGYILTNNHVVEDADEVIVTFSDGRELEAEVVGKDPKTDVAVIKVDATELPAITFADSDLVEVGDRVLAVGNPFGFGQTVTTGIVSAKGRAGTIGLEYEDFIQTDAAINPGNSGGALVDMHGRLIGINTAIYSRSGGFQGIGFAIPSELAQSVMNSLVQYGKVTRGYLGVGIQNLNAELVEELDLPAKTEGVLITEVQPDTPAQKAELRAGDVIIGFNGKDVTDTQRLRFAVAETQPGSEVPITVLRDGRERELQIEVGTLDGDQEVAMGRGDGGPGNDDGVLNDVGVAELTVDARRQLNVPDRVDGVVVTQVEPGGAAARAGLRPGMVIQSINREDVRSVEEAVALTKDFGDGKTLLRVWSPQGTQFVLVDESKDRDR